MVGVPGPRSRRTCRTARRSCRSCRTRTRAEQRLVARSGRMRRAELDLVQPAERLDEPVRDARPWDRGKLARVAVGAAPVGPEPGREQQPPVAQQQLLLAVEAQVPHRPVVLAHVRLVAWSGFSWPLSRCARGSAWRRGSRSSYWMPPESVDWYDCELGQVGVVGVDGQVEVQIATTCPAPPCPAADPLRLELELGWRDQVVVLLEVVRAADADDLPGVVGRARSAWRGR